MKINIYYGGRGMMDDPTLFVINKMQEVLQELNVSVDRYNLYELKNSITTLPQTLKDVDGIILASTVEWYGIGGYMQQFLDACWLYGDKEKIAKIYMSPIVMSTTYGEREAKLNLRVAWEILGGLPCSGICGYISDTALLEMNDDYVRLIEKKAENMYRTINQKVASFPASNQAVKQKVAVFKNFDLTPQETEQLSQYASDDDYVQRQKEDLQELASMFRGMMKGRESDGENQFIQDFQNHFKPQPGFRGKYKFTIEGIKKPLVVQVDGGKLQCAYQETDRADVEAQLTEDTLNNIVAGHMTFQRAFMGGDMTMKGDFRILRTLDQIFVFMDGQ
ncbi:MAG: SCP2 sterol-binding domain-containing protein [Lachnospiraceae bacterium]|nr:SCP2 sterol-binding domain-containing protein [Lachnospiraceae bacterium]MDD7025913.1 SCP2 sterol-binding domain-containing protein [Lachnospiraceae bacterium]MDY5701469.1 SCP2 sterol-binding domain-containing protein [Lachnospiraceae bacterium]